MNIFVDFWKKNKNFSKKCLTMVLFYDKIPLVSMMKQFRETVVKISE